MYIRNHRFQLLFALAAGALVVYSFCMTRQAQRDQERPYGRFTQQQILQRTVPLCQALRAEDGELYLSAEYLHNDDTQRRCWNVEWRDAAGRHIAQFLWDADTGHLCQYTCEVPPLTDHHTAFLNRREAVRAAWHWLNALGIAAQSSRWRVDGALVWYGDGWVITWRSGERAADICVDVHTGYPRSADSYQVTLRSRSIR